MTIEAEFNAAGSYTLRINVDPRTFLAADPTSLPPVPASWYQEQTPEQVAATHEKAQQYLTNSLGLLFNGQKSTLPQCKIRVMDGSDNTPLNSDTQEVHLLATASGKLPVAATTFQIDFAKDANTSLILLLSKAGKTGLRPQVVFPGETSRPFQLQVISAAPAEVSPPSETSQIYLIIAISVACIVGIIGWLLLNRFRHHHRAHRRAGDGRM